MRSDTRLTIALTMLEDIDKAVRTLPHVLSPLIYPGESKQAEENGFDIFEKRFDENADVFEAVLGLPGKVALVFPEAHKEADELSKTIRELRKSLHLNAFWKAQQKASRGTGHVENPEYTKIWKTGTDGNTPLIVENVRILQKQITEKLSERFGDKNRIQITSQN